MGSRASLSPTSSFHGKIRTCQGRMAAVQPESRTRSGDQFSPCFEVPEMEIPLCSPKQKGLPESPCCHSMSLGRGVGFTLSQALFQLRFLLPVPWVSAPRLPAESVLVCRCKGTLNGSLPPPAHTCRLPGGPRSGQGAEPGCRKAVGWLLGSQGKKSPVRTGTGTADSQRGLLRLSWKRPQGAPPLQ